MFRPIDRYRSGFFAQPLLLPSIILALLMIWSGCSFDYAPTKLDEEFPEQLPSTVLRDVEHSVMEGNQIVALLRIKRVERYHEKSLMLLSGVYFTEFNNAGDVVTEVWADQTKYNSETGDARAEGNVVVSSRREEARITTRLNWNDSDRMLTSDEDIQVIVQLEDGSIVTGVDFEADIARRVFRFLGPVSGELVPNR